jgi:hypothetical protein
MTTPERQQDPGEHGYGGTQQEKDDGHQEHPLEDPDADPRQDQTDPDDKPDDSPTRPETYVGTAARGRAKMA